MNKITETYILFLRRIRDAVLNLILFYDLWFFYWDEFFGYVESNLTKKNLWKFKRTTEIIYLFLVIVNYININNRSLVHVFYVFIARTLMIFFVSLSVQMKWKKTCGEWTEFNTLGSFIQLNIVI